MWMGTGLIPILIYAYQQAIVDQQNVILTQNSLNILTESSQNIETES